jgi:hypothetical protein
MFISQRTLTFHGAGIGKLGSEKQMCAGERLAFFHLLLGGFWLLRGLY